MTAPAQHRKRGQTMVEFALIGPVLILLLVGVAEVARAVYGVNAITSAAREGSRYGVRQDVANACDATPGGGLDKAVRASISGIGPVTITAQQATAASAMAPHRGFRVALGQPLTVPGYLDTKIHLAAAVTDPLAYCQVTVTWQFQPAGGGVGLPTFPISSSAREYDNANLS